jgi:AcrR family transcriptional regulator
MGLPMNRPEPRRAGRPDAGATERLNRLILATATRLFIEQGFAATSMEQIAAEAGAGKQTLYRRYASKQELFVAVVLELGREVREAGCSAVQDVTDPFAALRRTCVELLELVAKPETMAVHRILIAESQRFPTLFDSVRLAAFEPLHDVIRALLRAAQEAGQMRRDIAIEDALRAVFGLTAGWFLHRRLVEPGILPTEEARAAFFEAGWGVFTRGVLASTEADARNPEAPAAIQ